MISQVPTNPKTAETEQPLCVETPGTASSDWKVAEPGDGLAAGDVPLGKGTDPAARSSSRVIAGPRCRNCRSTEQTCAYNYGQCCPSCSHWVGYDDNGNPRSAVVNSQHRAGVPISIHRRLKRALELVSIEVARVTPTEAATSMAGATTGTSTKPAGPSWPFDLLDNKPAHCPRCGRRTPWRTDGTRIKHRIEADNPIAPYCSGGAA